MRKIEQKIINEYLIKKTKTDMKTSLKALNKKVLEEKYEEYEVDNIDELKDELINEFEFSLKMSKDDIFTKIYFRRLVANENSIMFSAYEQDVTFLTVFVYDEGTHLAYYIPDEIRNIIKKELGF